MNAFIFGIVALFISSLVFTDGFNPRVRNYGQVLFQKTNRYMVAEFVFQGKLYIIELRPNVASIHPDLKLSFNDAIVNPEKTEFLGYVVEPYPGKAILSHFRSNEYIGTIFFHNDTLHLEPSLFHNVDEDIVLGYFGTDTNTTFEFSVPEHSKYQSNGYFTAERIRRHVNMTSNVQAEERNRCPIKIVADYSFYSRFGKNNTGITTKFLVNMVGRINEIYTRVNWDEGKEDMIKNRGRFENMGFSIKEIKVLDRPDNSCLHYNSYDQLWPADKLLRQFAISEGSKEFCLVHLVTARSFSEATTLGLAYVAHKYESYETPPGGICSGKEIIDGKVVYMNVLFSTVFENRDQIAYPLVTKAFDLIVAHEYGHAWGAIHDPTMSYNDNDIEICSPETSDGGKYVMWQYALSGYDSNNVIFSPCSKKMIRDVLESKWKNCFEKEKTSFCGNGIIEEGEECDNGVEAESAMCCDNNCRLVANAQCSPLNHICCTTLCRFQNSTHVCLPGDKRLCKADAICTGNSGDCPMAPPANDGQSCIDDGECWNGLCLPFCEKKSIGKQSCLCENESFQCSRCCRSENGTCTPEPFAAALRDDAKCSQGYCKNNKCINEAIDQVRNYFFQPFKSAKNFCDHLKSNLVIITIIFITLVFYIINCLIKFRKKNIKKMREKKPRLRSIHAPVALDG